MIFGPSDAEFRVELAGAKKCVHQNPPKDRASERLSRMQVIMHF